MKLLSQLTLALVFLSPIEGQEQKQKRNLRNGSEAAEGGRNLGFISDILGETYKYWTRDWTILRQEQERYDVVIIGAGMAGMAAAAELQKIDPDITYIILESTSRVGGRVRSTSFGSSSKGMYTIEDGANWLYDNNDIPTWNMADDVDFQRTLNDYQDLTLYNETGSLVPSSEYESSLDNFLDAFRDAEKEADDNFANSEQQNFEDNGVVSLLSDNGFSVAPDSTGNMDYIWKWLFLDFEYASDDTSVRYFPYINDDPHIIHDQRGYQFLMDEFRDANIAAENIRFDTRVVNIMYDESICDGTGIAGCCVGDEYLAIVKTEDEGTQFVAKRVISTVSIGVINSGDLIFTPALKYSPEEHSPYEFAQYIKVFYQFPTKFWDNTQFVEIMLDGDNRGKCHHWQDMDDLIPGSGIIRCELMTEAFEALIDADTKALSSETLDSLLDPLRLAYGNETVGTPLAVYYPKLNLDKDFGYGAYANWKIGKTFTDFARSFGGIEELAPDCDHNGCNTAGEWVVHFAGAAICYEHAEFVHGAYYSGQRSARFVLSSLGNTDVDTDGSECDISFPELKTFGPPASSSSWLPWKV